MAESESALSGRSPQGFVSHFELAVQELRAALTELLASVGAEPSTPQAIARRFGLDKNLSWKISKIVLSSDLYACVGHLPGAAGVEILLRAFARAGAPAGAIRRVRQAMADFERMIEVHAGDRATLDLILSSMVPERGPSERLESSRKLAFQGNSATWGVQTRLRLGIQVVAPHLAERGALDVAAIGGLIDFRRLRPTATWPLVMTQTHNDDHSPRSVDFEPLDLANAPGEPPLLRDFCSQPLPATRAVPLQRGMLFELCEGPIGNTASIDCLFGWIQRRFASIWRDQANAHGEHYVVLNAPAEMASLDLLVHGDLPFEEPEVQLFSLMEYGPEGAPALPRRYPLPVLEGLQRLDGDLQHPQYAQMPRVIECACRGLGWELRDFRAFRITLRHPPLPTVLTLRYPLVDPT